MLCDVATKSTQFNILQDLNAPCFPQFDQRYWSVQVIPYAPLNKSKMFLMHFIQPANLAQAP